MILLQVICTIWTCLFIPLLNAEEFVPKVTETFSEYSFSLESFDDSNSLIRLDNRVVWMSFDSGENWEAVKEIEGHILELMLILCMTGQGFCFGIFITQILRHR